MLRQFRQVIGRGMLSFEVVPGVHQLAIRSANVYLLAGEELALIDTGFPGSSGGIVDYIRGIGRSEKEITSVIITHNHVDHMGSLAELRPLARFKVLAHGAGLAGVGADPPYPSGIRRLLRVPFLHPVRQRFTLAPDDVDVRLEGGEVLDPLGGLEVVPTPGHTPGSISLYSARYRMLFVGDALQKRRRGPSTPAKRISTDLAAAADSIARMAVLDFDILCFGHGRPLTEDPRGKLAALAGRLRVDNG
ncbi:MAG: MBL fold metallo-hydrolase [Dehalococcoidales bacterium]